MPKKEHQVGRHVFVFNPKANGGESVCLVTDFIDNGDSSKDSIYTSQTLSLQSYCNSAQFTLMGASLTPENLRQLANELESAMIKAQANCNCETEEKCV